MGGIYDLVDSAVAEWLEVPVEEYIEVIERCSYWQAYYIITVFWNEDEQRYAKAKAIYEENKQK